MTPSNSLKKLLDVQGYAVLDGAMGTELERRGADVNHPLWSGRVLRDEPDRIAAVHAAHLQAGADIITSASYQLGADPVLMARSVAVARRVCERYRPEALVVGALGPYGACLADGSEYSGSYGVSQQVLETFHRQRLSLLQAAEPDLFAFETLPSLQEAKAVVAVLSQQLDMSAWVSFTCKNDERVVSGDCFVECVAAVAACEQVVAVGVNCTAPRWVAPLLLKARSVTDKPLVAYPNRGGRWDGVDKAWALPEQCHEWKPWVRQVWEAGAQIIGGCCQTTPEDIAVICRACEGLV